MYLGQYRTDSSRVIYSKGNAVVFKKSEPFLWCVFFLCVCVRSE
jgi:hypothetical protein